jgi:hypothetical protein
VCCSPISILELLVVEAHNGLKADRLVRRSGSGLVALALVLVLVEEPVWSLHIAVDRECIHMALKEVP